MSDHTDTTSPSASDPRPGTLRLVRALGARLRTPLAPRRRDELAVTLAEAATGTGTSTGTSAGTSAVADVLPLVPRRSPAWTRRIGAAAAALVVVVGAVGLATRGGEDLPVLDLVAGGPELSGMPGVGAAPDMAPMPGDGLLRGEADVAGGASGPAIGWWYPVVYRFELADGLAAAPSSGPVWRLAAPDDLAGATARLAAALGLPTPSRSAVDPGSFESQGEDGSSLWVSAQGDWYYGGPWDAARGGWGCASEPSEPREPREPREPADGPADAPADAPAPGVAPGSDEGCSEPEPSTGVPSAERARELAVALFARVGQGDVRITDAYGDAWGAWVGGTLAVEGLSADSSIFVGVGFGGDEVVTYASGTLARPVLLGEYPLADIASAVRRLESELNAWSTPGSSDGPAVVPAPMPDRSGGAPGTVSSDGDAPVSSDDAPVTILPAPEVRPLPDVDLPSVDVGEPVEMDVRVVGFRVTTLVTWTASGAQVLVPHFVLLDADGGEWYVVAVDGRYLGG